MRPFETLARVETADGRSLTLHRRDGDWFINLDGDELMSSRAPGSERALGERACRRVGGRRPAVLVGGLGLGYTLRAALDELPRRAAVTVAEVFPEVVAWNREHVGRLAGDPLADPRVRVDERDVARVIATSPEGAWDAILLDVDNGPDAWCLDSNAAIYGRRGLRAIDRALAPGGLLAVWSAHRDASFVQALERTGFEVATETVRARGDKGSRHTIFFASSRRRGSR